MGDVGVLRAPGPGRTSQPGAGQPDQTAGHHDADVHDQRDDSPASQRARSTDDPEDRRQPSAARGRFRLRSQLLYDVQRKPFHAAMPAATSQANKTSTGQPRSCPFVAARSPSPSAAVGSSSITGRGADGYRSRGMIRAPPMSKST